MVLELPGPRQHQSGRRRCSSISAEETHGTSIDNRQQEVSLRYRCVGAEAVFADAGPATFLSSVGYCGFLFYRKQRWRPHYRLLPSKKKISKMEHCYTAHVTSSAASDEEAEPKPRTVQLSIVICPRLFIASNKQFDGEKKRTLEQLLAQ